MTNTKVLITGATASGKTTFVQSLADGDVLETDEYTSEAIGKPTTTVALDYTITSLGGDDIHVYGTPGQDRFHYMWRMLGSGADAMVFLLGANRPDLDDDAAAILSTIREEHDIPFVIAVTHTDAVDGSLDAVMARANALTDDALDITTVDARDADAAHHVVENLMKRVAVA
jgi:hypothetical protein